MRSLVFLYILASFLPALSQGEYRNLREKMVREQIQRRGINNREVLDALRLVKRHMFVPQDMRSRAYRDGPLPIGYGQTISQPYIVAYIPSN